MKALFVVLFPVCSPAFARNLREIFLHNAQRLPLKYDRSGYQWLSRINASSQPETFFYPLRQYKQINQFGARFTHWRLKIPPGKMLRCKKNSCDGFMRNKKHSLARNYYAGLSSEWNTTPCCVEHFSTNHPHVIYRGSLAQCIIMRSDINDVIYGWRRKETSLFAFFLVAFDERTEREWELIAFQGGWLRCSMAKKKKDGNVSSTKAFIAVLADDSIPAGERFIGNCRLFVCLRFSFQS